MSDPMAPLPKIMLTKHDYVPPAANSVYTIVIKSETGEVSTLTRPAPLADTFYLWETDLFPGNNWIRIQAEADCGLTGYSNAVSYNKDGGDPGGCLTAVALAHTGFGIPYGGGEARSTVELAAFDSSCPAGTAYNAYYIPAEGGDPVFITGPVARARIEIPDTPAGSGHGRYYFAEYDTVTKEETANSAQAVNDIQSTTGGGGGTPGVASMRTDYIHTDHLGSTRLVTDEMGVEVARYKYYPFGHYAEIAGSDDTRMKFTGHERDEGLGLDYMLARYYGSSLGRFLSVDPLEESGRSHLPQSWNCYAYVLGNPIALA